MEDGLVYGVCADVAPLTDIEEAGPNFSALQVDEDGGVIVGQIFIYRSPLYGGAHLAAFLVAATATCNATFTFQNRSVWYFILSLAAASSSRSLKLAHS
jgi:hypothetical protein